MGKTQSAGPMRIAAWGFAVVDGDIVDPGLNIVMTILVVDLDRQTALLLMVYFITLR
jgi:hypothetical protein